MFLVFSALTSLAQTDTNAPPALIPAYPELPPTFWQQHQTSVIVAGFALLVVAFLLLKLLLRGKKQPVPPPEAVARQALARLQSEPEDGNLLSAVSQILRRYLTEHLGLTNGELTTAEFIAAVARCQKMDLELGEAISSFLRECDVRKFSPMNNAAPLNAVNRAQKLIQSVEANRASVGRASPRAGSQPDGSATASPRQTTTP